MYTKFTWADYSLKLKKRILQPMAVGHFEQCPASMRIVTGSAGSLKDGNYIQIHLIVDESDGVIADSRFEAYGDTPLIGASDVLCELALRKNYDQALRIGADLIDMQVRDRQGRRAFPEEVSTYLNLALTALEDALSKCDDIPITKEEMPPTPFSFGDGERVCENWEELDKKGQMHVIEEIIAKEIRPYIELDAGGIEILSIEGFEVKIAYQGACTSCYAATGSTLSAIQGILRAKVHPKLEVIPSLTKAH